MGMASIQQLPLRSYGLECDWSAIEPCKIDSLPRKGIYASIATAESDPYLAIIAVLVLIFIFEFYFAIDWMIFLSLAFQEIS